MTRLNLSSSLFRPIILPANTRYTIRRGAIAYRQDESLWSAKGRSAEDGVAVSRQQKIELQLVTNSANESMGIVEMELAVKHRL